MPICQITFAYSQTMVHGQSIFMRLLHYTTCSTQFTRSVLDQMLDEVKRSRGVGRRDLATRHLW